MASAIAALKTLCKDQHAHPVVLARKMDEATGHEWRDWLPETIRSFVGLADADVQQMDKLMAVQVVLTNPDVADNWALFASVVPVFNHRRASFEWLDKPSTLELAWAVACMNQIQRREFQPGVIAYIHSVMMEAGLLLFPWSVPHVKAEAPGTDELVAKLEAMWANGLGEVTGSEIDERNPVQAAAAHIVACQDYIRANEKHCAA